MERTKLTWLQVHGYRCLRDLSLELRDLNVLIGPNGVGKTSLLETAFLHRALAEDEFAEFVRDRGGLPSLVAQGEDGLELATRYGCASEENGHLFHDLGIASVGIGFEMPAERVAVGPPDDTVAVFSRNPPTGATIYRDGDRAELTDVDPTRSVLCQSAIGLPERDQMSRFWRSAVLYEAVPLWRYRAPFRQPQTLRPVEMPGMDGDDFLSALYNLQSNYPDAYERLEEAIRAGFPRFRELRIALVGAGVGSLAWHERGLAGPLAAHQLSAGMLRYLWLCTMLLAPKPPSLVMLDEPEISLHPQLLLLLASLLQEAATKCQLIVATHSAELINWLEPAEVVVLDQEEDDEGKPRTITRRGDQFNLDEWLKKYTLGEAWTTGMMGGRS